jgi:hypothetical protein
MPDEWLFCFCSQHLMTRLSVLLTVIFGFRVSGLSRSALLAVNPRFRVSGFGFRVCAGRHCWPQIH